MQGALLAPAGRGHQIALVTIEGKQWIAEMGQGTNTPRVPVPLELDQTTTHDGQMVRLVNDDHFGIMFQIIKDDHRISF